MHTTMNDLTFIIPIRVDSEDRLNNCHAILRFLTSSFPDSEILLIEQDETSKTDQIVSDFPSVKKLFVFNAGRFSKSNAINLGILSAKRDFICMYDTDVLIHPEAMSKAVSILRRRISRVVIPFNLICVDVSGASKAMLASSLDIERYGRIMNLLHLPTNGDLTARIVNGGIMVADREVLLLEGGYNKKMISYGWEDTEFLKRFDKLGYYSLLLSDYNLVHLDHKRGTDSQINEMYEHNRLECEKVAAMDRKLLQRYVETDLDISLPNESIRRNKLRQRQALTNLFLMQRLAHLLNKVLVYVQVLGLRGLFGRLVRG